MKKSILALFVFFMIALAIPASAQILIQIPPRPRVVIILPPPPFISIGVYQEYPAPYYKMPEYPYPDRWNSYRTGSYEDYPPPSPPTIPPGVNSPYRYYPYPGYYHGGHHGGHHRR